MKKVIAVVLLPLVIFLIVLQTTWESVCFFCTSIRNEFISAYESYAQVFSSVEDADEESDWWNYS